MFVPTEHQEKLADYLKSRKEEDFDRDIKLGILLLCRTDGQAKEMLEFCEENPTLEDFELLEKAVEIHQKIH